MSSMRAFAGKLKQPAADISVDDGGAINTGADLDDDEPGTTYGRTGTMGPGTLGLSGELPDYISSAEEPPTDEEVEVAETTKRNLREKHRRRKGDLDQTQKTKKAEGKEREEIRDAKRTARKKLAESLRGGDTAGAGSPRSEAVDQQPTAGTAEGELVETQAGAQETGAAPGETITSKKPKRRLRDTGKRQDVADSTMVEAMPQEDQTEDGEPRQLRRSRLKGTRFDDTAKLEDGGRRPGRRAVTLREQAAPAGVYIPTEQEAFDFFSKNWEAEPEPSKEPSSEAGTGEAAAEGDAQDDEKAKLLENKVDPSLQLKTEIGGAMYTPTFERLQEEKKTYFTPSSKSAPLSDKLGPGFTQERYLEEEGFYVGRKPPVSYGDVVRVENRLLKHGLTGTKYFGEDGRLIMLPDPTRELPYRPILPSEKIETVFVQANVRDLQSNYIGGVYGGAGAAYIPGVDMPRYQMLVDVNCLQFTHHHLMSREHVLAEKLKQLYEQYAVRAEHYVVDYLRDRLRAIRIAIERLEEQIVVNQSSANTAQQGLVPEQQKRLDDYLFELRRTRRTKDVEEQCDRSLLQAIVRTWKEIKNLRNSQQYTNTAIKLQINKEDVDYTADDKAWNEEVDAELWEQSVLWKYEHQKKLKEYEEALALYKDQQSRKKAARKRLKPRERKRKKGKRGENAEGEEAESPEKETQEISDEQLDQDRETVNEPDLPKPDAPVEFEPASMRERIISKLTQQRRRPGEPKLYPQVLYTATVTANLNCPPAEANRRDQVDKLVYFIRVIYNNKEVSTTSQRQLNQDFRVNFGQIFNLQIIQWPDSVRLELHEETRGVFRSYEKVADIYLAIPKETTSTQNVKLERVDFSSDQQKRHNNTAVGSGVLFNFQSGLGDVSSADTGAVQSLYTTGFIFSSTSWAVDEQDGRILAPQLNRAAGGIGTGEGDELQAAKLVALQQADPLSVLGTAAITDIDKLIEWVRSSKLDPNDPNNAGLMYLINAYQPGLNSTRVTTHFRLAALQEEFNFATDEEISKNPRFRMLELRDKEIPEFRHVKMVPALPREIRADAFREYEDKLKRESMVKQKKDIESHRQAVTAYLQRVREQILLRFREAAHQKSFVDMVNEKEYPTLGAIVPTLFQVVIKRPLRPARVERKKVPVHVVTDLRVQILVSVLRAVNLPHRQFDTSAAASGRAAGKAGVTKEQLQLRPFVEVTFQGERLVTHVAEGSNPVWNVTMHVPFRPTNLDYNIAGLQTVRDSLYLNLVDEVITDVTEGGRGGGQIRRQVETRLLGTVKIPFSTIYTNGRVEGTFRLDMPAILLGYEKGPPPSEDETAIAIEPIDTNLSEAERQNSYLQVYVTLDPALAIPEMPNLRFETREPEELMLLYDKWKADLFDKFSEREYTGLVVDLNGRFVLATRYLRAIKPPDEVINISSDKSVQAHMAARYVSLIPFMSDALTFSGLCDIWSTADQFFNMLSGDEEEHATMLACFLLYLGFDAAIVTGVAIPEGDTSYVLTFEGNQEILWNPQTGQRFNARQDIHCPLQQVHCVIRQDNIYANIQARPYPREVDFNFQNKRCWKPLFPKPILRPSVQPEAILYEASTPVYVNDLRDRLETQLKSAFGQWRSEMLLTISWNRACIQQLRAILIKLEEAASKSEAIPSDIGSAELQRVTATYDLTGYPINMSYLDNQTIIERVKAAGIHLNTNIGVEFALCVYIKAYSNNVLSVWIYLAALTAKHRR